MGDGDVRMDRCWRVNGFAEDLHKIGVSIVRQYVRVPQSEATLPRLLLFWREYGVVCMSRPNAAMISTRTRAGLYCLPLFNSYSSTARLSERRLQLCWD